MESKGYYTDSVENNDLELTDRPLYINCAGVCSFKSDFTGGHEGGRKDYYLFYLSRGNLDVFINGAHTEMKSSQLIIFSPGTPCIYKNKPGECTDYYWIHITGSEAGKLFSNTGLVLNRPTDIMPDERIILAFQSLFEEFIIRDNLFFTSVISKLMNICTLFGRAAAPSAKSGNSAALSESLKYIDAHYREPISIKKLSGLEHLSEGHFRLLFRQKTGMSPRSYITALRLRNASVLLKQTDLSIKEISAAAGFDDQLYFSRVFKKHFNLPPKEFRKRQGIKEPNLEFDPLAPIF